MTPRNLRARIKKVEASRKHIDEMLVVWRLPGADIEPALANANYVPGDRVICLEWYGDGPPPSPRWCRDTRSLSKEETDSMEIMVNRVLDALPKREQLAGTERRGSDVDLSSYSEQDLDYILFGVPDGLMIRKSPSSPSAPK
jgi:hypothetical protein